MDIPSPVPENFVRLPACSCANGSKRRFWNASVIPIPRVDLKKNIIRKQNRDINNREIYAYLHDIFGPSTLDLFDIHYEDEDVEEDSAQNKQNDTKESQKEEES